MSHKLLLPLVLVITVAASAAAQPSAPFVFSNNFWVNLHQRLQAGKAGGADGAGRSGGPGGSDVYAGLATLNPVFDAQLVAINDALGRMPGDAASVTDEAIDPAVRAALNQAAKPWLDGTAPFEEALRTSNF